MSLNWGITSPGKSSIGRLNADFEYWPQKRGFFRLNVGNGNRIYSSKVLDELKAMPDSIFNFDLIHLDYFKDLYFNFRHSFEITNGLDISVGFSAHKRTAVENSRFVITGDYPMPPPEFMDKLQEYLYQFCPAHPCGMDAGTLLLHERKA